MAFDLVITQDFFEHVLRPAKAFAEIVNFYDPRFGLKGEFLDVLISRKSSAADLLAEPGGHQVGAEIP